MKIAAFAATALALAAAQVASAAPAHDALPLTLGGTGPYYTLDVLSLIHI